MWSYTGPNDSPKDEVRFLLGDTTEQDQSLSDEEIQYLLDLEPDGNVYYAAANAAETMAAKYLKLSVTQKKVGELALNYNNSPIVADKLYKLAIKLRQGRFNARSVPAPKMADESDNIFWVGMNDNGNDEKNLNERWTNLG